MGQEVEKFVALPAVADVLRLSPLLPGSFGAETERINHEKESKIKVNSEKVGRVLFCSWTVHFRWTFALILKVRHSHCSIPGRGKTGSHPRIELSSILWWRVLF